MEKKLTYSAAVAAFFLPGCEFGLKCLRSLLEVFLPWKLSSGQARYIGLVQTFFKKSCLNKLLEKEKT